MLPINLIKKNLVHNYCRTCHSFQGGKHNKPILIFDHKSACAYVKWLYAATTKDRDLKQAFFYAYDEGNENWKEMNRSIDDANFRTEEWLMSCVSKARGSCGDCLSYIKWRKKIDCNLTALRVNKNEAHHLDNIRPYCVYCNTAMSSRGM